MPLSRICFSPIAVRYACIAFEGIQIRSPNRSRIFFRWNSILAIRTAKPATFGRYVRRVGWLRWAVTRGIGMSRQVIGLSALAAAIMVAIVCIASTASVATNRAGTEIYSIDLTGGAAAQVDELSAQKRVAR
jgi:hypothetical protein